MRLCCGKFSLTTWHVLSEEGEECLCVCVMVTLKINTHVCLGHLFCQTATRQRRFTFTHRHRADEMSECKRERKKICLLCAVCFFLRVCVLSLFLSLSPTALANNEMYLNSPTQSIGLFVLHVCYSLSLFLSCSLSFNDSRKLPPNCCCGWVFFSFSLNRLQAHTKYKKKRRKNTEKQTLYRKLFLFWTLTQSYDDFVLLPHLREWDARRRAAAGTGRRSRFLILSLAVALALAFARLLTRSRDKCFVSGQIKIMKQARILFNCTRT